jgi:hypothetical protein
LAAGVRGVRSRARAHLFVLILLVSRVRLGAALGVFIAPLLASATCVRVDIREGKAGTGVSVVPRRSGSRVAGAGFLRLPLASVCPIPTVRHFVSRSARGVQPTTSPSSPEVAPRARRVLPTGSAPVASGRVRVGGGRRTSPRDDDFFLLRQMKITHGAGI